MLALFMLQIYSNETTNSWKMPKNSSKRAKLWPCRAIGYTLKIVYSV